MTLESKRVQELEIQRGIKIKIWVVGGQSEKGTECEKDIGRKRNRQSEMREG